MLLFAFVIAIIGAMFTEDGNRNCKDATKAVGICIMIIGLIGVAISAFSVYTAEPRIRIIDRQMINKTEIIKVQKYFTEYDQFCRWPDTGELVYRTRVNNVMIDLTDEQVNKMLWVSQKRGK